MFLLSLMMLKMSVVITAVAVVKTALAAEACCLIELIVIELPWWWDSR